MSRSDWAQRDGAEPPVDLLEAMYRRIDAGGKPGAGELYTAARERLDAARAAPGRVRDSAFDLLVADALLTHASAAALDTVDPEAVWTALLAIGRR